MAVGANDNNDQSGSTLPFPPEVTLAVTVNYDFDLVDMGRLTPRMQSVYKSEYGTGNETLYSTQLQEAYTKTDLSLIWTSVDEKSLLCY
ncbi:MAG: hypothetical protein IIB73_04105 [Proteobacteria bacterium]|nr:hypothetical protein [Pseudomonadota bacterium]